MGVWIEAFRPLQKNCCPMINGQTSYVDVCGDRHNAPGLPVLSPGCLHGGTTRPTKSKSSAFSPHTVRQCRAPTLSMHTDDVGILVLSPSLGRRRWCLVVGRRTRELYMCSSSNLRRIYFEKSTDFELGACFADCSYATTARSFSPVQCFAPNHADDE